MERVVLRKERVDIWGVVVFIGLIASAVAVVFALRYLEEQEWQSFARDNHCVVLSKRMPTQVFNSIDRDGHVQHESDILNTGIQTTWTCSNNRTYVR